MKEKFDVTGMSCAACSTAVTKAVNKVDGVEEVDVNLLSGTMIVSGEFDDNNVINAVAGVGYGAVIAESHGKTENTNTAEKSAESEYAKSRKRFFISLGFLLPVSTLAMLNMFADKIVFSQNLLNLFFGGRGSFNLAFVEIILTTVILIINLGYFTRGFKSLFRLNPNMDSLIAVGSSASYIYGVAIIFAIVNSLAEGNLEGANTLSMSLYFESAAMIPTLISLGKLLESKSKAKATGEISAIVALAPKTARVIENGVEKIVSTENIAVGDLIKLVAGDVVAADGTITEGVGSFDESALTGESIPSDKEKDNKILSGSTLLSGYVIYRADKTSENSAIQRIAVLVEEAANSKAPIQKFADKVAGVFVPIVMGIALVTFIAWLIIDKNVASALTNAVSVLVISCPCSLGLATPVAIMVGTGVAARKGILLKSGEGIQTLADVKTIVFDKTGTITNGKPCVTDVITYGVDEKHLLDVAYSVEDKSAHSLSGAIKEYAEKHGAHLLSVEGFESVIGKGLIGVIDNKKYLIGNASFAGACPDAEIFAKSGKTPVIISQDGKVIGVIALFDEPRKGAKKAVLGLKSLNIRSVMLTGDKEAAAKYAANSVGIDSVYAEVLPEDKRNIVMEIKKDGVTAFVGDGVNDAAAIKEADVGIAMSGGSEIAVDSGDIVLVGENVEGILSAVNLGKRVMKKIKQNLFWAFFYNALCIPLAAGVLYKSLGISLNPMIAAACMSVSSLFVVTNSLTINKKEKTENKKEKTEVKKMKKEMIIDGMMCSHCQMRVEKALGALDGVSVKVDLSKKLATLELTKDVSDEVLKGTVEKEGYTVISIK